MEPVEDGVEQGDQGEEADEHDADVEGELAAVDGAAGDGSDEVLVGVHLVFGDDDAAFGGRGFGFGDEHFGQQNGAGRGHDDGGEQVARLNALGDVHGHDAAGDVGHAAGHDGHEFGAGGAFEEGADGEGSLGLAHKDGGGDVHGLRARDAHGFEHDPGEAADDDLHEADVVHDGEKGGDEDDCGEDLEGEDGAGIGVSVVGEDVAKGSCAGEAELAEEDLGAGEGGGEHVLDDVAGPAHGVAAEVEAENEEGEEDLESESPGDGAPADGLAVGGAEVGSGEDGGDSQQTGETFQRWTPCG